MTPPYKARQRAVRLTDDALELLNKTIEESWRANKSGKRLTRQTRAVMLGVSLPTVDRILSREGVDRSSLVEAFKSVGIPWRDQYCESEITPQEVATSAAGPSSGNQRNGARSFLLVFTGILIASLALGAYFQWPRRDWTTEYDYALSHATNLYSKGKYKESEEILAKAMEIGESKKTSRNLEAALKLRGDLAAARGRLAAAVEYYRATIRYRELRKSPPWGPIHEVVATIQIRLGDYEEARKNLDIAHAAFVKSKEPNGVAEVMRSRGTLAFETGNPDQALEWFAKCLQLLSTRDASDLTMDVRGRRALVLVKYGRLKEAQTELEACLTHWTKGGNKRWIGLTEWRLGQLDSKMGRTQIAIDRLSRARQLLIASGDESRIQEVELFLKKLMAQR